MIWADPDSDRVLIEVNDTETGERVAEVRVNVEPSDGDGLVEVKVVREAEAWDTDEPTEEVEIHTVTLGSEGYHVSEFCDVSWIG